MKIINLIILAISTNVAVACSCVDSLVDLPIEEMGWMQSETKNTSSTSYIIFTGILLDGREVEETYQSSLFYETKETKHELIFKLIKSYKGDKNDTIRVRTNNGSDACGFTAKKNTECLIFGSKGSNGYYYTYRSDCCKSISKEEDEKKYNKYIEFMESLENMIDGEYVFFQSISYWRGGYRDVIDTLEAIRYNIKNGKLEGIWQIKDRRGRILEKGLYKNGQKSGTWEVISHTESDLEGVDGQIRVEKIRYQNGKPRKSIITIEDWFYSWEEPFYLQTIRKQKIRKKYRHFNIKK